jgi:hypothetical protein
MNELKRRSSKLLNKKKMLSPNTREEVFLLNQFSSCRREEGFVQKLPYLQDIMKYFSSSVE